jgi:predicted nucleotidyltransferase
MFLYKLTQALDDAGVDYAIVGGFAVALHGAIRGTVDVDIILKFKKNDFEAAEQAFKDLGFQSRLPVTAKEVFNFREEYIKNRNLMAWSFYNPKFPSEVVDIVLTHDLAKLKTTKIRSGGLTLKVLSIEDLIEMKRKSGRPQDLEDIKALQEIEK